MKTSITAFWLACGLTLSSVSFSQSVTEVGSLSQPTMNHSATLLDNGKVLLVAPDGRSELFDPTTNTWSLTGAMAQGSEKHTATRLANGKVLVTGGFIRSAATQFGQGAIASSVARSEIYDPATGLWASSGALPSSRAFHTATRLANGSVIVIGGATYSGTTPAASDAIAKFDPSTEQWTTVAALPAARTAHTSTLLAGGNLLVLGGSDSSGSATNSCFRFHPSTLLTTNCANMPGVRSGHVTTSLSDGRIFLSGGALAIEAFEPIYDPIQDSWMATATQSRPYANHAAVERNGNSVVLWGGGEEGFYTNGTQQPPSLVTGSRYFVVANQANQLFTESLQYPPGLAGHSMTTLVDGRTLVVGGYDSFSAYQTLGVFYTPRASSKSYAIGRQPAISGISTSDGRTPFAAEVGERYFARFGVANGSWNPLAPTGTVSLSDGGVGCVVTLPTLGCRITANTSGPKQYAFDYSGDIEYLPSQSTSSRPIGQMLRIERRGHVYSHVEFVANVPLSTQRGKCGLLIPGIFYFQNCDVPIPGGTAITFSVFPVSTDTFVGWQGACVGSGATCSATMPSSGSLVVKAVFAATESFPLKLDIDNNGVVNAATDGQLIRRFMSRVHDTALTQGVLGTNPQRNLPDAIEDRLNDMAPLLDVDQNGRTDSATDGLIILRFLLGFRGNTLTAGAIGLGARRSDATEIAAHLQSLMP